MERTVSACLDAIVEETGEGLDRSKYTRCEHASTLVMHLQRLLKDRRKFVIVFDGIDALREAQPTLMPALARIPEIVRDT